MRIVGFVGEQDNPRAVKILDSESPKLEIKTIAIKDVCQYHIRPEELNDKNKKKGDGHYLLDVSYSRDLSNTIPYDLGDNYIDDNELNNPPSTVPSDENLTPKSPSANADKSRTLESPDLLDTLEPFNFASRASTGPMSSSPKRVTISDEVTRRTYNRDIDESFVSYSDIQQQESGNDATATNEETLETSDDSTVIDNHQPVVEETPIQTSDQPLISFHDPDNIDQGPVQWKSLHLSTMTLPDPDTSEDPTYNSGTRQTQSESTNRSCNEAQNLQNLSTRMVTRSQTRALEATTRPPSRIPQASKMKQIDTPEVEMEENVKKKRVRQVHEKLALLIDLFDEETLSDDLQLIDLGSNTQVKRL